MSCCNRLYLWISAALLSPWTCWRQLECSRAGRAWGTAWSGTWCSSSLLPYGNGTKLVDKYLHTDSPPPDNGNWGHVYKNTHCRWIVKHWLTWLTSATATWRTDCCWLQASSGFLQRQGLFDGLTRLRLRTGRSHPRLEPKLVDVDIWLDYSLLLAWFWLLTAVSKWLHVHHLHHLESFLRLLVRRPGFDFHYPGN